MFQDYNKDSSQRMTDASIEFLKKYKIKRIISLNEDVDTTQSLFNSLRKWVLLLFRCPSKTTQLQHRSK